MQEKMRIVEKEQGDLDRIVEGNSRHGCESRHPSDWMKVYPADNARDA